jgi:hypothetical protein
MANELLLLSVALLGSRTQPQQHGHMSGANSTLVYFVTVFAPS